MSPDRKTYGEFLRQFIGKNGALGGVYTPEFELGEHGGHILTDVQKVRYFRQSIRKWAILTLLRSARP